MNEERPPRFRTLFAQALAPPKEQRSTFLDAACRDDPELRADLESLLDYDSGFASDEHDTDFLKSPLVHGAESTADDEATEPSGHEPAPPPRIVRYRIVGRRGEGGISTVYEAEQDNPRRTVALKVIRSGLVSLELVKRFKHEAQILAHLHHPGIAQVYEAGMSEDGRPFFAMEFIRGIPLDEYAQSWGLDTRGGWS